MTKKQLDGILAKAERQNYSNNSAKLMREYFELMKQDIPALVEAVRSSQATERASKPKDASQLILAPAKGI